MAKFCGKCGTKLEDGQDFCPQCGHNLNPKQNENNLNTYISDSNVVKNKFVLSRKNKASILGVGIVAVLLIIFFMVGNSLTSPSKTVSKFEKAVAANDKKEVSSMLYCDDNRLEMSEKNIAPLITYFKDNPSYLNTVIQNLNSQPVKAISGSSSQSTFSLACIGKKMLFFPDYKICVKPSFIQVKTSIKDVSFSLNNTQIGKSDSDNYTKEFGPFIPGKYKLLASYKGKYTSLNETHDINFIQDNNSKINVEVFTNLKYVKVAASYPEAEIFVNGKGTGVKVQDAENFGPINSDTRIYAIANQNGKNLKSREYTVSKDDDDIYLDFSDAENRMKNVESQLHELIDWYTYYFSSAVNNNNFPIVEDYLYPGSEIYKEQQSYIPSTYSKGIKENILSFNITSYKINEDNTSGTINTEEVYNIDDNGKSSVKTFKCTYTFKYNESKNSYQLESIATGS